MEENTFNRTFRYLKFTDNFFIGLTW